MLRRYRLYLRRIADAAAAGFPIFRAAGRVADSRRLVGAALADSRVAEHCGVGAWRSLVAHLPWAQGVAGSNPVAPTIAPVAQMD